MFARLVLLACLAAIAPVFGADTRTNTYHFIAFFHGQNPVSGVTNSAQAAQYNLGIRNLHTSIASDINKQLAPLTQSYSKAVDAGLAAKLPALQAQGDALEAELSKQQTEFVQLSAEGADLLLRFTGDARLRAELNRLAEEDRRLFNVQVFPQYRKAVSEAVAKLAVPADLKKAIGKAHGDFVRANWKLHWDTNAKVEVLLAHLK